MFTFVLQNSIVVVMTAFLLNFIKYARKVSRDANASENSATNLKPTKLKRTINERLYCGQGLYYNISTFTEVSNLHGAQSVNSL